MTLGAALATGVFVYLLVGRLTGYTPKLRFRMRPRAGPRAPRRQVWLTQAGVDVTPAQFSAGSLGAAVGAFLLVILITGAPVVAFVPAFTVGLLPKLYFARRRGSRMREVQQAWPDGIRHVIGGIASGLSMHQAVAELAVSGPGPLRMAFERFAVTARMVGTVAALEIVKEQLADSTSDRVIEVLVLAHERGGRIVTEVLRDLADAIVKDLRAMEEIETDRLEQKINSRAVFALPWFVLVVMTSGPGPFREFYQSFLGLLVVGAGGAMSLLGMWLVSRLARDPSEQRVFGAAAPVRADAGGPA